MSDPESDVLTRHNKKCHMLMTMQKLFQSHAYNQGSAPSSSDVRAEPQKEPQSVVQLPFLDLTPQNDRASAAFLPSKSSPAKVPLHPVPEESFPPATTPPPKPPRQLSLRVGPSKMLISDLKSQRQASKGGLIDDKLFYGGNGNYTRGKGTWDTSDSFLPRAKPPPPLKLVPKRTSSKNIKSPSDPSISSRPSLPPQGSSQQLSKSRSMGSRPMQRTIGMPILEMPMEGCDDVVDVRPSLTRSSTRTTISSEASASNDSNLTLNVLPPEPKCAWNWKPPASWSGPPENPSVDEDSESKPGGGFGFIGRKRAKSVVSRGGAVRNRLKSARSSEKLGSVHVVDGSEPEEIFTVVRAQKVSVARAEVVEIQCYKGWDEKPVADVIHELRELKCK